MRLYRLGGLLILVATLATGCGGAPAAAVTSPSPSAAPTSPPSPSPSAAPSSPSRSASPQPSGPTSSREPIILESTGTTDAAIAGGKVPFTPTHAGGAQCRSVPDGTSVGDVTALDLGQLGSATLRGTLTVSATAGPGAAELFVDGGDLPEGSFQPFWQGRVEVTSVVDHGASGSTTFSDLVQETGGAGKPGAPGPSAGPAWPAKLAGSIIWTCAAWSSPLSSSAP